MLGGSGGRDRWQGPRVESMRARFSTGLATVTPTLTIARARSIGVVPLVQEWAWSHVGHHFPSPMPLVVGPRLLGTSNSATSDWL